MIFPGALGDLLLALPALRTVRRRHDAARVTLVVAGWLTGFARILDAADAVASLDDPASTWLFGGEVMPAWLAGRPVVHTWLAGRDAAMRDRLGSVAHAVHGAAVQRGAAGPHASVAYMADVGMAVPAPDALAASGRVEPPASARVTELRRVHPGPWLALHRGAGSDAKRWHEDGFATVAAWWRRRGGVVLDVHGPAEAGLRALDAAVVVRDWSLTDLAALLAVADGWCGHDSGPSHLAGAVGTPGVVLYGPTDPARWRPLPGALRTLVGTGGGLDADAMPPARVVAALATALNLDIPGTGH